MTNQRHQYYRSVIHVSMPPQMRELIEKRCKTLGMTVSEYVRWLVREDLIKAGMIGYKQISK